MTTTTPIIEKIRAGRRAALASLNARIATGDNVVSFYEGRFPARSAVLEFHSVRRHDDMPALDERIAA